MRLALIHYTPTIPVIFRTISIANEYNNGQTSCAKCEIIDQFYTFYRPYPLRRKLSISESFTSPLPPHPAAPLSTSGLT